MQVHIQRSVASCFAVLRQLRSIRRTVPSSVYQSLVVALVLSRLDYGNATLAGLPASLLKRLQSVLNAAARSIARSPSLGAYYRCSRQFPLASSPNRRSSYTELFTALYLSTGGLKTRDWKRRDGQKCKVGKRDSGKRGTRLQWWKTREKACMDSQMLLNTLIVVQIRHT